MSKTDVPKPLAAAAGAGDLAVEKIREVSKRAVDRLSSIETDPSAFADRVQEGIETRAESLGSTLRSVRETVSHTAGDLSEKAQAAAVHAFEQAGDAYETLAKRGENVVGRLRGEISGELESGETAEAKEPTEKAEPKATAEPAANGEKPAKKTTAKKASSRSTTKKTAKASQPRKA